MATRAEKAGPGPCPQSHCRKDVMFKTTSGGLLRYSCQHCDSSGYAEPGGTAHAAWSKTIKAPENMDPAAVRDKTAPAAPRAGFTLGAL